MCSIETFSFPKSAFTSVFVRENGLDRHGFTTWVFYPGMESGALNTWWGKQGKRARPHEGVDLLFYRGFDGKIFSINTGAKIPVMYDGLVAKIIDDFLGKTIIIEHKFQEAGEGNFFTLYGHTNPVNNLVTGQNMRAGDIVATLASSRGEGAPMPHLHLTLAWNHTPVAQDALDWTIIGNPDIVCLVDPQPFITVPEM